MIDLIIGYKYRWFASVDSLSKDIENSSDRLRESMDKIYLLMPKIMEVFEEVKKLKPEFDKLHVQVAKLKEYHPELQNQLHEETEELSEKTSSIFLDIGRVFNGMEKAIMTIKDIVFDADAIIYKESKQLDKFASKIGSIKDSELARHVMIKINETKEELMSVARKLFEAAKAEEKSMFPESGEQKQRTPISQQIRSLGIKVEEIGRILDHLDIDDIDDIVKNSEDQLDNLKKIEMNAVLAIKKLEGYMIDIKNKLYLLEDDVADKTRQRTIATERKFDKVKADITKNAENLLKDIEIVSAEKVE